MDSVVELKLKSQFKDDSDAWHLATASFCWQHRPVDTRSRPYYRSSRFTRRDWVAQAAFWSTGLALGCKTRSIHERVEVFLSRLRTLHKPNDLDWAEPGRAETPALLTAAFLLPILAGSAVVDAHASTTAAAVWRLRFALGPNLGRAVLWTVRNAILWSYDGVQEKKVASSLGTELQLIRPASQLALDPHGMIFAVQAARMRGWIPHAYRPRVDEVVAQLVQRHAAPSVSTSVQPIIDARHWVILQDAFSYAIAHPGLRSHKHELSMNWRQWVQAAHDPQSKPETMFPAAASAEASDWEPHTFLLGAAQLTSPPLEPPDNP